jgi:hypothetical protein
MSFIVAFLFLRSECENFRFKDLCVLCNFWGMAKDVKQEEVALKFTTLKRITIKEIKKVVATTFRSFG